MEPGRQAHGSRNKTYEPTVRTRGTCRSEKRTRKMVIVVQFQGQRLCRIFYAEKPCSLSKLDLGLCWFDDRLNTVLPRFFNLLFEFSPSVS